MKAIIIYYSLDGNTDFIAHLFAERLGAKLVRLIPEKEIPMGNFSKYFWGGKSVVFNEKPKLVNDHVDLSEYDVIMLGTPIWAGSFVPPFATFFDTHSIKNKKVFLYACHRGGASEKFFSKFQTMLEGNEIVGKIDFPEPLSDVRERVLEKVDMFVQEIKKQG